MRDEQNIARARSLRRASNLPEQTAWRALRGLRDHGWPVRRQHAIGRVIVDFAIVRARLAIEIDGSIHQRDDVAAHDGARDAALAAAGWRILRVPARTALSGDALLARVRLALASHGPSP